MEKKMDKKAVTNAMHPLDLAFSQLGVRKEDKEAIKTVAEKVKENVKIAIIEDVTASLKGVENVSPSKRKGAAIKPSSKKPTPVKGGKQLPLDVKGLVKEEAAAEKGKAPAPAKKQVEAKKADASLRGTSTAEKPTKAVWAIADKMKKANPNVKRAEVLAACANAGIAHYTARTQYQLWKSSKA